jgi:alpha-1,3-rhamnosyl/mannosyltransferase
MRAGIPVVVTAGGAVPEIAGDGAIVVPVGDATALAIALDQVLSNEDVRSDLVTKGRARAELYSWAATAEAMVKLYTDAADAAGSR